MHYARELTRGLVHVSLSSPIATIGVWIAFLVASGLGLTRLEIDTSTTSFLDRGTPAWEIYQRSVALYGGDEVVAVAIASQRSFDREALSAAVRLTRELSLVPGVRRVDSLSSVPLIRRGTDGAVTLDAGLEHGVPSPEDLGAVTNAIEKDRVAPGNLISRDGTVVAVNVLLDERVDGDRQAVMEEIYSVLRRTETTGQVSTSGVPVFRTKVNFRTAQEVARFGPLTLGLMLVILLVCLRSVFLCVLSLVPGAVGVCVTLGVMGAVGTTVSLSTMILPSVLLALGCAYSVHITSAARYSHGFAGLSLAAQSVARPVALSGATTAIGFGAMSLTTIAAIRELATFGAVGVLVITAAVLSLVPALLAVAVRWRGREARGRRPGGLLSRLLTGIAIRRSGWVLVIWMVVLCVAALGVTQLRVESDIIRWFPQGSAVRDDYERIRAQLSGITPVNIVIQSRAGLSVTEPRVLAAIDRLSMDLEGQVGVGKALSVADAIRMVRAAVSDDRQGTLPETQQEAEQYLLILEGSEHIWDVITPDYGGANIVLRVNNNSSREIVDLAHWVEDWWDQHGPSGFTAETTGIMFEFGRAQEAIAYSQIRGLAVAVIAIGLVMWLSLRSPRTATIALIPNAVPLAIVFGVMGLAGIPLDAATVCLGSLALGIAVDDTIHLLNGFEDGRVNGLRKEGALEACMQRVLPALTASTACIAGGFGILALSEFVLIQNLGVVTAGLVVSCLIADVTLLPALLVHGREGNGREVG